MGDRLVLPTDLYPVAPGDAPEQQPNQLQSLTKIVQQIAAQVETLSVIAAPTKHTSLAIPTELRVDDSSSTLYQLTV
jgi:NifB/MoaA-like Fe-S oxidoreductase